VSFPNGQWYVSHSENLELWHSNLGQHWVAIGKLPQQSFEGKYTDHISTEAQDRAS